MKFTLLFTLLVCCGCATTSIGSSEWHTQRISEIDEAFRSGEITKLEYLQLKNEADQVRATRKSKSGGGYLYTIN